MSKVLETLSSSTDPVDRELARTLRAWQNAKASSGLQRRLGREPAQIASRGAVYVIEKRIRSNADGFNEVGAEDSYEAIVEKYPDRFAPDVVVLAHRRLENERVDFEPTSDIKELEQRVQKLLVREHIDIPTGNLTPKKNESQSFQFYRDPKVKAYVLKQANGRCEACGTDAPFTDNFGRAYLEVHHVKTLADGGSDRVSNAVALCPNCHRAVHHASDLVVRISQMYKKLARLVPE